jgi:hypothetical protein
VAPPLVDVDMEAVRAIVGRLSLLPVAGMKGGEINM